MSNNKNYTNKQFNKDLDKLNKIINNNINNKNNKNNNVNNNVNKKSNKKSNKNDKREYRNFTVCKVNGKNLKNNVGKYRITSITKTGDKSKSGPVNAAHKAAVSLVKKNEETIVKKEIETSLTLLEITRGSSRKMYGPYIIVVNNLTSSEYKKKKEKFKKMMKEFKKKPSNFIPKKYDISVKLSD